MIPPLHPSLLASNPQFAALHKTLTTRLLDPDASTKATNTAHLSLEEEFTKILTQTTRQRTLLETLRDIAISDRDHKHDHEDTLNLPSELRELIYVVSTSLLAGPILNLTPSHAVILSSKIQELQSLLPRLLPALSSTLTNHQKHLYALSTTSPSHQSTPSLPPPPIVHLHLLDTTTHLYNLLTTLHTTTTTLNSTLTLLLTLSTTYLTHLLTHLSGHTHSTLSRSHLSTSTHTLTMASTLLSKLQLLNLESRRSTYSPSTQTALSNYASHLDLLLQDLTATVRTLEDELRLYAECDGRGGETMGQLARRYGEVLRETAEVKADVERLEGGQGVGGVNRDRKERERKFSRRDWEIP